MNLKRIGNEVSFKRKSLGLNQKELADKCGVSFKTISTIENGKDTSTNCLGKVLFLLKIELEIK